jgi:hypothetical protein
VTNFVPAGTGDPGINAAWLNSFGTVENCVVNVSLKHSGHGCGLFYAGGNNYGWTYRNAWLEGAHYGVVGSMPWNRRVTANASTNRLIVANGGNPYQNGHSLFVAAHGATGSMPNGLSRGVVYYVVGRDGTSFQISATSGGSAIDLTSAGSGSIYVHGADAFAAEYSPDGITLDRMTAYGARCPVSLTNTENLHIGRIDSYGAVSALELLGRKSKNRKQHLGPVVDAVYSESPQATNMPAGEDIAVIDAVAGRVNYLQVRGADTGSRPQIRFRGEGYQVNLDVISSLAQQQPDIRIEGAGIELTA